jgi:hypothetical protein
MAADLRENGIDRKIEYSFEIKLLGLRFRASEFLAAQRKLLPARSYLQLLRLQAASADDQRSNGIAGGDQKSPWTSPRPREYQE